MGEEDETSTSASASASNVPTNEKEIPEIFDEPKPQEQQTATPPGMNRFHCLFPNHFNHWRSSCSE